MPPLLTEGFTPEFLAALTIIGEAMEAVAASGGVRPILVGGAALELWTTGAYVTGDFDLVSATSDRMEAELVTRGFRREDRAGRVLRGLYHPELGLGVDFVSGRLFDGLADELRVRLVRVSDVSQVRVIPVEDVIADRLGQFAADRRAGPYLLEQARLAFQLAKQVDRSYLDRRIRQETNDELGLSDLEGLSGDGDNRHSGS